MQPHTFSLQKFYMAVNLWVRQILELEFDIFFFNIIAEETIEKQG